MKRVEKTVFISYRRDNFPWALSIYQDLITHGFDVFFDYFSINSGEFENVIIENIKARTHFIVVLTPSALERCSESGDWLRREIEIAIDEHRNIVPVMLESFDFGSPAVKQFLTGKLARLNRYNGIRVPADYFHAAMERLRTDFLNVALDEVGLVPLSPETQEITESLKTRASEASKVEKKQLSAQEWFERGYVYSTIYPKNVDEAIRCFSEAIKQDPTDAAFYYALGNIYNEENQVISAIEIYHQAIGQLPNNAAIYNALGTLLNRTDQISDAEKNFRKAIELDPDYMDARINLANLLENKSPI